METIASMSLATRALLILILLIMTAGNICLSLLIYHMFQKVRGELARIRQVLERGEYRG